MMIGSMAIALGVISTTFPSVFGLVLTRGIALVLLLVLSMVLPMTGFWLAADTCLSSKRAPGNPGAC